MKKEHKFRRLIGQLPPDKPSAGFTGQVMQEINTELNEELNIHPQLTALLKRVPHDRPHQEFTSNVMLHLESDSALNAKPLITTRVWYAVAAAVAILFVFFTFSDQRPDAFDMSTYLIGFGSVVSHTLNRIAFVPNLYILTFLSISILLLVDYFLKNKSRHRISG